MINIFPDLSRPDLSSGSSLQMVPRELLLTPGTFHLERENIFSGVRVPSRRHHLSSSGHRTLLFEIFAIRKGGVNFLTANIFLPSNARRTLPCKRLDMPLFNSADCKFERMSRGFGYETNEVWRTRYRRFRKYLNQ
ncbi:hypothetical protein CEXT_252881 [Caerostris extrusa]|uniref:Uncharacterized protein n=1 Tax=Caerostris extrusa TaxID=172846 RepID=A0AAV4U704_CAEEX|nr:hypothetical protein CEXT_252881 [Caerostris extrusa]